MKPPMKILGRDPATILAFLSACVQMAVAFGLDWSDTQTAAVNAGAAAVLGLATACLVARDQILPAVLGLTQAALTLGLAFGLGWSADQCAMLMSVVAAGVGLFGVRPNVQAIVSDTGDRVPRELPYRREA